jgi:hypothetical protein
MERTLIEDLLVSGLDDVAYAGWVRQIASQSGIADADQLRELSLGIIAEVIAQGLVVPGDYDRDGHHPWPHSPGEAIERITRAWLTEWRSEIPPPGAIVWLANTEAGTEIGRRVLAREAGDS